MCGADNRRVVAVDSCAAGATSVHCAADRKGIQAPKDISLAQGRQKKRKAGSRNDRDTDTAKKNRTQERRSSDGIDIGFGMDAQARVFPVGIVGRYHDRTSKATTQ